MKGLFFVLLVPFIVIMVIIGLFVDFTVPLNQIGVTIFGVVYWIIGIIISIIVAIKLQKAKRKKSKSEEEVD
ncbi:MAG: hypothetical protein ACFFGP_16085 [Promethearchaeota archaeon]